MSLFGALWYPASVAAEIVATIDYLLTEEGGDALCDDTTGELLSAD